jgi:HSP20 family protein
MNTPCCTPPTQTQTQAQTDVATPEVETRSRPTRRPRYRIANTPEAHTIQVELPGVAKESVRLNLEDGVLNLSAARTLTVPESWKPLHRELSDAGYELRLQLNDRVDDTRLSAKLEDGVLTLVLPVKEAVKPRLIAIQ